MFDLGQIDPERVIFTIISFLVAITVHEFMHAWTAMKLGDNTALHLGRVTLNPVSHFDPLGGFLFILIALGFPAIAWGKPVPVNMYNLRPLDRFGKKGSMAVVALAGPFSNVVMAAVAAIPLRVMDLNQLANTSVGYFLLLFVSVNLWLAAFNMIPLPPLDGSKLLMALLPRFWTPYLAPLERYGFIVLLALVFLGPGRLILDGMVSPFLDLLQRIVLPI